MAVRVRGKSNTSSTLESTSLEQVLLTRASFLSRNCHGGGGKLKHRQTLGYHRVLQTSEGGLEKTLHKEGGTASCDDTIFWSTWLLAQWALRLESDSLPLLSAEQIGEW